MTFSVTLLASGIAVRFENLDVARDRVLRLPHGFSRPSHIQTTLTLCDLRIQVAALTDQKMSWMQIVSRRCCFSLRCHSATAVSAPRSLPGQALAERLTVDGQGVVHRVDEVSVLERLLEAGQHEVLHADEVAGRLQLAPDLPSRSGHELVLQGAASGQLPSGK